MRTGNRHKATGNSGKAVRNQWKRVNRLGAKCFLGALCASAVTPIFDLRLLISALCALLFALCSSAESQQQAKLPRIGYVAQRTSPTRHMADPAGDAFQQGLRDLGYVNGKNILIDYRYADGSSDRLRTLVADLVRLHVDVIVSPALPAIRLAKQATNAIPIVMVITGDPVASGLVDSLARPGGNVTGLTRLTRELSGKRLELLREVMPNVARIGVLLESHATDFKDYEAAARTMKLQLQFLRLTAPNPDFDEAFQAAAKAQVSALVTISGGLTISYAKRIAELAIKHRLPSMHERIEFVQAGGLISYSTSDAESFRRAAVYVDKVLKGAKPADLPVEQPTKFELIINIKTAKQIGLTIPPNVLARADRVIR
jgi:putative ABC transport system substrate-binding protein